MYCNNVSCSEPLIFGVKVLHTYVCVLYSNQTIGGWSSEGIVQDSSSDLPVECTTTHLTSFAVLVSTAKMKVIDT